MLKELFILFLMGVNFSTLTTSQPSVESDSRGLSCIDECNLKDHNGPVCDEMGYEYQNECQALECAKIEQIACYGHCPCRADCSCDLHEVDRVCGANHITYRNKCDALCHEVEVECECSKESAVCNDTDCNCWANLSEKLLT